MRLSNQTQTLIRDTAREILGPQATTMVKWRVLSVWELTRHYCRVNLPLLSLEHQIAQLLAMHPAIKLGILFGSVGRGQASAHSDLDLAVATDHPLEASEKVALIEVLAQLTARPIDLVDLRPAGGLVLQEILTKGKRIYCTDNHMHAELIKRMLFNEADFMPYRDRMLAERRKAWIGA